ncbi:hypothetical protein GCM10027188_29000 [Lysobacter humi (ex Lee et al. 2017)]
MVSTTRPKLGVALLALSLAAASASYFLSWRSGCLFDPKVGTGAPAAAEPFSVAAWSVGIAALALFSAAIPLGWRRSGAAVAASALFALVLGGPVIIGLVWAGESAGVASCAP